MLLLSTRISHTQTTRCVPHLQKSFSQITRCSIASKLDFSRSNGNVSLMEANITSLTWILSLDNPAIQNLTEQEYFFDTSMPLWIEIPSDITSEPTVVPSSAPIASTIRPNTSAPSLVILPKPAVSPTTTTTNKIPPTTTKSAVSRIMMNRLYIVGLVVATLFGLAL